MGRGGAAATGTHGAGVHPAGPPAHPAAVTAGQQSLSQLGQMLTQQGLSLGHTEVGQHDRGENQGRGGATPSDAAVDDTDEVHGIGPRTSIGAVGLLDAFA